MQSARTRRWIWRKNSCGSPSGREGRFGGRACVGVLWEEICRVHGQGTSHSDFGYRICNIYSLFIAHRMLESICIDSQNA